MPTCIFFLPFLCTSKPSGPAEWCEGSHVRKPDTPQWSLKDGHCSDGAVLYAEQQCRSVKHSSDVWQLGCRALLTCMEPLERVFKDADSVALSSLVSTVQMLGGPGPATQASPANTAAVSMFDDDLDVGASAAVSGANRCDILFQW